MESSKQGNLPSRTAVAFQYGRIASENQEKGPSGERLNQAPLREIACHEISSPIFCHVIKQFRNAVEIDCLGLFDAILG